MDLNNNATKSDHQKCYFYCPECEYEEILNSRPKGSIANLRGGYGRPVYHSICPKCHAMSSGCMYFDGNDIDESEKYYIRDIINLYAEWSTVYIELEDGQNGYDEVFQYVERYWNNNTWEDTIVALKISYNGEKWRQYNEIISPCNRGAEWLNDWWEGEKYIRILGIKSVDKIDIFGGIYAEDN